MRTPAQIEASRRNGAKSSGPRTEQGKEKSSRNACKHGLSSYKIICIDGESEEDWQYFQDAFLVKFQPRDFVEERLVLEMAAAQWRIERAWTLQTALHDQETAIQLPQIEDTYDEFDNSLVLACAYKARRAELDALTQHETRLSRLFDRALRKLNEIRAKYPTPAIPENEPEVDSVPDTTPEPEPTETSTQNTKPENEPDNPNHTTRSEISPLASSSLPKTGKDPNIRLIA